MNEATSTEAKIANDVSELWLSNKNINPYHMDVSSTPTLTPYSLQHTRSRMQMKRTCVRYSYLGFKYKAYQHDHRYHKHITLLVLWSLEKLISITRILSMNFVLMDSLGYASVSICECVWGCG